MLLRKLAFAAGIIAALAIPGVARASSPDDWSHAQAVIPGDPCGHVGDKGVHQGPNGLDYYECLQKWSATCPHWAWVYNPSTPKSGRTAWPHPTCPCVSVSATSAPTPSATPSTSPADTSSPQPVHSTAIAVVPAPNTSTSPLPVTGSPVVGLGALGGASIAVGGLILFAVRIRRTGRP